MIGIKVFRDRIIRYSTQILIVIFSKQEQEVIEAHIPPAVAIRGCNTFREKTKLSEIS